MEERFETLPLGSVVRSRLTGMTLVRMRAGWVNFNQSVTHHPTDPEHWDLRFKNE